MNNDSLWSVIDGVRKNKPLVHNITNQVVMPFVANCLLAAGAAPIMAHAAEEMDEITGISDALALNIGTITPEVEASMRLALRRAAGKKIPVVIDPVGAGSSNLRTRIAKSLLENAGNAILKGNATEVRALAGKAFEARGVESTSSSSSAVDAARELAGLYGCIVCISGEADYVIGGRGLWAISGGCGLMSRVTGMGCAATALVAACAGSGAESPEVAVIAAMAWMSAAGSVAAKQAVGPGTYAAVFLDALYSLERESLFEAISFKAC